MELLWNQIASTAGVTLTDAQHAMLEAYLDLLLAANDTMNLTRIADKEAARVQHVADSLTVLPFLPAREFSLADVGTGGGVPGIPLAIARPQSHVLLIESTGKKANFLTAVVSQLRLTNVKVAAERAEDVGRSSQRETFDVALSRAVATMQWLAEWCLPLVKPGGKMLAMKGPKVAEELPAAEHAIKLLGGGNPDVRPANLPGYHQHVIVEITKSRRTPAKFPRPASAAKGKPIL